MVVAQLAEWSLPTPLDLGLNPVKLEHLSTMKCRDRRDENKEERGRVLSINHLFRRMIVSTTFRFLSRSGDHPNGLDQFDAASAAAHAGSTRPHGPADHRSGIDALFDFFCIEP